jgi:uncharacterized protein YggE
MYMKKFYEEFKNPLLTIVFIFAALFLYTKFAGPIQFSVNSINTTKTDLFSSTGEGKATAVPDQATVDAGITQQGSTIIEAQNKVNTQTQKIISEIKNLGISDKEIKTTNYSVSPNYTDNGAIPMIYPIPSGGSNITSYTVTQNLEINVKDLNKVNKVIDAATTNGANLVGGANFTFSDELQKKLENQARTDAVKTAKEEAQNLANISGISLGKIVNVVENSNFPRSVPMMAGAAKLDSSANSQTTVTPGENSVIIDVTIYYETF